MNEKTIRGVLIEDDPEDTLLLMDIMAKSDWPSFKFQFTCAEDLTTGLELLDKDDPEVVLLDLMLPESQGLETVQKVRDRFPDIPIVVLTGLRDETLGLEAVTYGAQDYQVKGSITGHELKRTISYAVERHRSWVSLKNIIDGSPDGMAIIDPQGAVQYANPAAEALLARKSSDMLEKQFPYPLPKGLCGEIGISREGVEERTAEIRISEIEWKGRPARLALIRDITDLRRIERLKAEVAEQRRMDKLKDELMSAVSHEMRTPLAIIKAVTSSLREGLAGPLPKAQTDLVNMQHRNVQRLEKIIERILDMSRLESGKAKISPRRVDAAALIREAIGGFRLVAGGQNILIRQEVAKDLPAIYADPELFMEVLGNIIDNALRFAEAHVWVKAEVPRGDLMGKDSAEVVGVGPNAAFLTTVKYVKFSVIDDGPGIPKERIGELFNKFIQVSRSSKGRDYKGTGLGLAICKEIIDRQDGRIWVESDLGQGARFNFILPQYDTRFFSKKVEFHAAK